MSDRLQPWWVVPKQLAGMCKPTQADLADLRGTGVSALVSLLSDDSNLDLYQQSQIPHIWVPIVGGTGPTFEQLEQIKTFVDTQNALGNAVAIHCSSGRRRTGTVIAALLIKASLSYEQALNTILAANPDVELRAAQLDFLKSLSSRS
ncbi:MAG: dual specificity protein phosphatase family protein [Cyanobacteria bacterium P01_H01_bin.21]